MIHGAGVLVRLVEVFVGLRQVATEGARQRRPRLESARYPFPGRRVSYPDCHGARRHFACAGLAGQRLRGASDRPGGGRLRAVWQPARAVPSFRPRRRADRRHRVQSDRLTYPPGWPGSTRASGKHVPGCARLPARRTRVSAVDKRRAIRGRPPPRAWERPRAR